MSSTCLGGDARALGWAVAAAGIGGFGGALVTATFAGREPRSMQWLLAGVITALGLIALATIHSVVGALPALFTIGVGTLAFLGATNTLIQMLSPDAVRGRAIAVYTMVAIGVVPAGSLILGAVASVIGLHAAFALAGAIRLICIVAGLRAQPDYQDCVKTKKRRAACVRLAKGHKNSREVMLLRQRLSSGVSCGGSFCERRPCERPSCGGFLPAAFLRVAFCGCAFLRGFLARSLLTVPSCGRLLAALRTAFLRVALRFGATVFAARFGAAFFLRLTAMCVESSFLWLH